MCINENKTLDEVKHERLRLDRDEFIKRSDEAHNGKYDYSKACFTNTSDKVCIICPKHGEFWMTPLHHYHLKQGCPKCSGRNLTQDDVIERAIMVHGSKYDYSKVNFTKMHDKVTIICPIHGDFEQTPSKHISKRQGCPKCGKQNVADMRRKTTERFISEAISIYGSKYDYSETKYESALKKTTIICKEHGPFLIRPNDHLNGHACPRCSKSHLETEIQQLLDENSIEYEEQKKFQWLNKQSLDFYLPKYNIAIECQGLQHFKPVKLFGGKEEYEIILERDNRKRQLCDENNVKILYFTNYKDIDAEYTVYNDKNKLIEAIYETQKPYLVS